MRRIGTFSAAIGRRSQFRERRRILAELRLILRLRLPDGMHLPHNHRFHGIETHST